MISRLFPLVSISPVVVLSFVFNSSANRTSNFQILSKNSFRLNINRDLPKTPLNVSYELEMVGNNMQQVDKTTDAMLSMALDKLTPAEMTFEVREKSKRCMLCFKMLSSFAPPTPVYLIPQWIDIPLYVDALPYSHKIQFEFSF